MTAASAAWKYVASSALLVVVAGWILTLIFEGPAALRAIALAGGVSLVVQGGAFVLARRTAPRNRVAGWGAGAGISLATLIVFGIVVGRLGIPMEPALLAMATFLFATELIEPFFLR
jgi:hypothetical protein